MIDTNPKVTIIAFLLSAIFDLLTDVIDVAHDFATCNLF